jgi:hypothetical protein
MVNVTVLDIKTRKGISGALVTTNTGDKQTANAQGQVAFPDSENGMTNYLFSASATDYNPQNNKYANPFATPNLYFYLIPIDPTIAKVAAIIKPLDTGSGWYGIAVVYGENGNQAYTSLEGPFNVYPNQFLDWCLAWVRSPTTLSLKVAPATAPPNAKVTGPYVVVVPLPVTS